MIEWRNPWSLLALLVVLGLAFFLVDARRRRAQALAAFVAAALQAAVAPDVDPRRRTLRAWLLVAGAALLVVAVAGPLWGFRWEQVRRQGIDLVVALDTSRSMLATDVKPNRFARAQLAVRDLVAEAPGDRLALVAFAGTAFLQTPLTLDHGAFLESLAAVEVGIIPRGGTALSAAIDTSLAAFEGKQANHQAVVLITDGENQEGDLDAAIGRATERGVRIFTVGIGTPEGELLPGADGTFFKDRRGQVVKSRLDQATLERIAVETGGVYLHAAGPGLGLPELYRDHIATLDKRELESTLERRREPRYQIPLGLAFLLLLLEPLVGDRRVAGGARGWRRWRAAAAALLLGHLAIGWFDPQSHAREGNRLYDDGKYDEAAERYNQALVDDPDSARLQFNLGDARFKAGKYDDALASFGKVPAEGDDPGRGARSAYNAGNTKFRQGQAVEAQDPQRTLQLWDEALAAYRRALGGAPDDRDAKFNHELVEQKSVALRKKLEEQKQDQKQDQKQQQNGDQNGKDDQPGQQDQPREPQDQQQKQPEAGKDDQQPGEQTGQDQGKKDEAAQKERSQPEDGTQAEQPGQEPKAGEQPAGGEPSPDGDADGEAGRAADGTMTSKEAAALLDAQRTQEMKPGEFVARQQPAEVAEPAEDW